MYSSGSEPVVNHVDGGLSGLPADGKLLAEKTEQGESEGTREEQYTALFVQMVPRVRALARRLVWDQDVEDLVADVFLTVWRRWEDLPVEADSRASWILGVTRNASWHARRQHVRSERLAARVQGLVIPVEPAPERTLLDGEAAEELLGLISADEADLLRQVVLEDVPVVELAATMDLSLTALRSRIQRARQRLLRAYTSGENGTQEGSES